MASANGAEGDVNAELVMSTSMSGNLSFELVLSPPRATASPRASKVLQSPTGASSPISLEAITSKLKTAEENRGRRLDEKLEKIKEHVEHASDVCKARDIMQTLSSGEDSLRKIMMMEELRQQHLEDLVHKLKEHEKSIEQVHKRIGEQVRTNQNPTDAEELERQLGDASLHRDMVLQAIREKQQEGNGQAKAKENITP